MKHMLRFFPVTRYLLPRVNFTGKRDNFVIFNSGQQKQFSSKMPYSTIERGSPNSIDYRLYISKFKVRSVHLARAYSTIIFHALKLAHRIDTQLHQQITSQFMLSSKEVLFPWHCLSCAFDYYDYLSEEG